MWCVDGVWVVMRAGVQASGAMLVWVGGVVHSLCGYGVWEAVGMLGVMVGRVSGAPAGVGRVCLFFMGRVCVLVVW